MCGILGSQVGPCNLYIMKTFLKEDDIQKRSENAQ